MGFCMGCPIHISGSGEALVASQSALMPFPGE